MVLIDDSEGPPIRHWSVDGRPPDCSGALSAQNHVGGVDCGWFRTIVLSAALRAAHKDWEE